MVEAFGRLKLGESSTFKGANLKASLVGVDHNAIF